MTTVAEFVIGADPAAWSAVGFDVDATGMMQLGGIRVRFVDGEPGMRSWVLADAPAATNATVTEIDGLATTFGDAPDVPGHQHANTAFGIDHVVIYTPHLEQTCDAIASATGAPLKRIREVGALRQGFHRLGEVVVEVVTYPTIEVDRATFWGLALNVADIDIVHTQCGDDLMSPPKDAVQSGRRIASFRAAAQLGLPVAVMTVRDPREGVAAS